MWDDVQFINNVHIYIHSHTLYKYIFTDTISLPFLDRKFIERDGMNRERSLGRRETKTIQRYIRHSQKERSYIIYCVSQALSAIEFEVKRRNQGNF